MNGLRETAAAVGFFGACAIGAAASVWTGFALADGAAAIGLAIAMPAAVGGYIAAWRRIAG